jgi:hypothetical protein
MPPAMARGLASLFNMLRSFKTSFRVSIMVF